MKKTYCLVIATLSLLGVQEAYRFLLEQSSILYLRKLI
jgi:hypothetical protein